MDNACAYSSSPCASLSKKISSNNACREGMIDYIIRAEQPFNMMETDDYSKTIQTLINPHLKQ